MDASNLLNLLTMVGEWGIVIVIFWELESNRLDHFLDDAFSTEQMDARREIFEAYCGLETKPGMARNLVFRDLLATDNELRKKCDRTLTYLSLMGHRLPILPPFRRKAATWFPHTAIFMWEILHPYVQQKREDAGRYWAGSFIQLVSAGLKELQRQGTEKLELRDPNHTAEKRGSQRRDRAGHHWPRFRSRERQLHAYHHARASLRNCSICSFVCPACLRVLHTYSSGRLLLRGTWIICVPPAFLYRSWK